MRKKNRAATRRKVAATAAPPAHASKAGKGSGQIPDQVKDLNDKEDADDLNLSGWGAESITL
jgi:hypothetical protein